jgi:hypothetical protein
VVGFKQIVVGPLFQGSPFRAIPAGIQRFWGYRAGPVAKTVGIPLTYHTCKSLLSVYRSGISGLRNRPVHGLVNPALFPTNRPS